MYPHYYMAANCQRQALLSVLAARVSMYGRNQGYNHFNISQSPSLVPSLLDPEEEGCIGKQPSTLRSAQCAGPLLIHHHTPLHTTVSRGAHLGGGVYPALGVVLGPLVLSVVDALLEVQRRLGRHFGRHGYALHRGVPPGVLQPLGCLHEDHSLALPAQGMVSLDVPPQVFCVLSSGGPYRH